MNFGTLVIQAPKASGNVALVQIDHSNHNVEVTLNGQTQEFNPSSVFHVEYMGGKSGGDTFTDNTSIISQEYGYGSGNNFTGGTSFNYVYFLGTSGGNTYNAQGAASVSDVFEYGGVDTINNPSDGLVQVYCE